jgi:hypothetical protein
MQQFDPGPAAAPRPVNTLAVVSLAAGIAGYVLPHPFIGGLVAIVTGHIARGQIRRTGEGGAPLATAGMILGYVHLLLSVLVVGFVLLVVLGLGAYLASRPQG